MAEKTLQSAVIRYSVAQALTEVALGSAIHASQLPLGGHALSLNQGVLLTLASKNAAARRECVSLCNRIATTVATLKAFSPMGSRLTPMAAISAQGVLFSIGPAIFGVTLPAMVLGSALLSLWGWIQPLLVATFLFGASFWLTLQKIGGWNLVVFLIAAKTVLAAVSAAIAWRSGPEFERRYLKKLEGWSTRLKPGEPRLAPIFFGAVVLSVSFFFLSGNPSASQIAIYFLRVIAASLLVFWASRAVPRRFIESALERLPQLRESVDEVRARLSRT